MRKAIITACCVAFIGGLSAASAQTTAPPGQDDMKTNSPSDMKMKKKSKGTKKSAKSGMKKEDPDEKKQ